MIAPPNINEVDDRWGGARSLIPMYTLDYLDDKLGGGRSSSSLILGGAIILK